MKSLIYLILIIISFEFRLSTVSVGDKNTYSYSNKMLPQIKEIKQENLRDETSYHPLLFFSNSF